MLFCQSQRIQLMQGWLYLYLRDILFVLWWIMCAVEIGFMNVWFWKYQGSILLELINECFFSSFQAFFITNDEPVPFWSVLSRILVGLGYDAPKYNLPYWLVYFIAVLLQFICALLSPFVNIDVTFTPMKVALAGTYHYYSCERAKKLLGYKPIVSLDEALQRTIEHFEYLRKGNNGM